MKVSLRQLGPPTIQVDVDLFQDLSMDSRRRIIEKFLFDDTYSDSRLLRDEVEDAIARFKEGDPNIEHD